MWLQTYNTGMGFRHVQKVHHHEKMIEETVKCLSNVKILLLSGSLIKDSSSSIQPMSTLYFSASCMIVSLPISLCNAQGVGIDINIVFNLCSYELGQGMFPTLLLWLSICILSNLGK